MFRNFSILRSDVSGFSSKEIQLEYIIFNTWAASKANNYALSATEEAVTETIAIAGQWQKVTEKALKGGVQLLDNQQNLVFDALETYKNHFVKGRERFRKIFA